MTKRKLITLGLVAALLGGGYCAANWVLALTAQTVLRIAETKLPPNVTFAHGALTTSLWRREVTLADVTVQKPNETITAQKVTLHGWPWYWGGRLSISQADINDVQVVGAPTVTVQHIQINHPAVLVQAPNTLTFMSATMSQAIGSTSSIAEAKTGAFDGKRLVYLNVTGFEAHQVDAIGTPLQMTVASLKVDNPNLPLLQDREPQVLLLRLLLQDSLRGLVVEDMTVKRQEQEGIHLDKLVLDGQKTSGIARTALGITVDGLRVARFALPPDVQLQLTTLGQDSLQIKGEFATQLDPDKKKLVFYPAHLLISDMIDVTVKGEMSNIQSSQQLADGIALAEAGVLSLELHVRDLGYVKRRVDSQAKIRGVSHEAYIAREMENYPMLRGTGASLDRLRQALTDFGLNSGELVIVARPPQPVSLMQLVFLANRPNDLLQKLGVFATVNAQAEAEQP